MRVVIVCMLLLVFSFGCEKKVAQQDVSEEPTDNQDSTAQKEDGQETETTESVEKLDDEMDLLDEEEIDLSEIKDW